MTTQSPPTIVTITPGDAERIRSFGAALAAEEAAAKAYDCQALAAGDAVQAFKAMRERFKLPTTAEFIRGDFLPSMPLAELAEELIARYPYLQEAAQDLRIKYLWKAKGGAKGGKATLGKCVKTSGLASFYSSADFVVWLAADHAWAFELNAEQVEALLFHELLHIGKEATDAGAVYYVRPHDFEGFRAEVHEYGFWSADIKEAAEVFQLRLEDALPAAAVTTE